MLVRLPDDGWQQAEQLYEQQRADLFAGREPQPADNVAFTLKDLCNKFLLSKHNKIESGELSRDTFSDYQQTCDSLIDHFGKSQRIDELRPEDFEALRKKLAKRYSVVSLKNEINRCRIVFKFAHDQGHVARRVNYGQSFDKPALRTLRKARNEAGPRLFTADEVQSIIKAADPFTKAMTLLGINGGLGNTDVANLPISAIDFASGWLTYPRPKTEIRRRIPLWKETLDALKEAISQRPKPSDPADAGLCFLTIQGNRWVRTTSNIKRPGRYINVNTISHRFGALLKSLEINGRKGIGFYTLRHNFETIGGGCKDQVAVDAIMGHADQSMAAVYREHIGDDRLLAVVHHVHAWLYGKVEGGCGVNGVNDLDSILDIVRTFQSPRLWQLGFEQAANFRKHRAEATEDRRIARETHSEEWSRFAEQADRAAETYHECALETSGKILAVKDYCRLHAPHALTLVPRVDIFGEPPADFDALADRMVEVEAALLQHKKPPKAKVGRPANPFTKQRADFYSVNRDLPPDGFADTYARQHPDDADATKEDCRQAARSDSGKSGK